MFVWNEYLFIFCRCTTIFIWNLLTYHGWQPQSEFGGTDTFFRVHSFIEILNLQSLDQILHIPCTHTHITTHVIITFQLFTKSQHAHLSDLHFWGRAFSSTLPKSKLFCFAQSELMDGNSVHEEHVFIIKCTKLNHDWNIWWNSCHDYGVIQGKFIYIAEFNSKVIQSAFILSETLAEVSDVGCF